MNHKAKSGNRTYFYNLENLMPLLFIALFFFTPKTFAQTCDGPSELNDSCGAIPSSGDYCQISTANTTNTTNTTDREAPRRGPVVVQPRRGDRVPRRGPVVVPPRRGDGVPRRGTVVVPPRRGDEVPRRGSVVVPSRRGGGIKAFTWNPSNAIVSNNAVTLFLPSWQDSLANNEACLPGNQRWQCYLNGGEIWANTSRRTNSWEWQGTNLNGSKDLMIQVEAKSSDVKLYLFSGINYDGEMTIVNCLKGKTCRFVNPVKFSHGLKSVICQRENLSESPLANVQLPLKDILLKVSSALDEKIAPKAKSYSKEAHSISWHNAQTRCIDAPVASGINSMPGCADNDNPEARGYLGVDGFNKYRDEILLKKSFQFKPKNKFGFIDIPRFVIQVSLWMRPVLKAKTFKLEFKEMYVQIGKRLTPMSVGASGGSSEGKIRQILRDEFKKSFQEKAGNSQLTVAEDIVKQIEDGIYDKATELVMDQLNLGEAAARAFAVNNVLGNKRRLQFTYLCDGAKNNHREDILVGSSKCDISENGSRNMDSYIPRIILNQYRTF